MKHNLVLALLTSMAQLGYGQTLTVEGSLEYTFFQMSTLRGIQGDLETSLQNSGIPAKVVESFPSYYGMQGALWYRDRKALNVGICYGYSSTGGRVNYRDYSGEYSFDQIVERNSFGVLYEYYVSTHGIMSVALLGQVDIAFTSLLFHESLRIGQTEQQTDTRFETSATLGIMPGLSIELEISPFVLGMRGFYYIDSGGSFHLKDHPDATLKYYGSEVTTEWNAFGIEAVIGLEIANLQKPH